MAIDTYMKQEQRIENLVSAGGVVYRHDNGVEEVVICGRGSPMAWGLPKGTPDPGETREQTAMREVREETGLEIDLQQFIDSIDYWFGSAFEGVRYHKVVFFYLMSPTGGDLSLHDHEYDVARWIPADEALNTLAYENEVRIVQKAVSLASKKT